MTKTIPALAVSLIFFAAGCGKQQSATEPTTDQEEPVRPAPQPDTGRLIVHVKGMTKALNLF
jgi:hypothetical protein